jgi:hypothetical protein
LEISIPIAGIAIGGITRENLIKTELYYNTACYTVGTLVLTLCPLFIWKYYYLHPLDIGIVLNEEAIIMNSKFRDKDWNGLKIEPN